jgi:hypothetical protein
MWRTRIAFLVAAASTLALAVHGATAASLNPTVGVLGVSAARWSLTQHAHGCHYTCECGPLKDFGCEQVYHRHLHMLCLPVRCGGDTKCDRTPPEGVCRHVPPQ